MIHLWQPRKPFSVGLPNSKHAKRQGNWHFWHLVLLPQLVGERSLEAALVSQNRSLSAKIYVLACAVLLH